MPARPLSALGVILAAILLTPLDAAAQTPSTLDTMRVVNISAAPGDTFFFDLYLRNVDTLGGYTLRVRYNSALIEPLTDTTGGDSVKVEVGTQLRDPIFDVFSGGVPEADIFTIVAADFPSPGEFFRPGGAAAARFRWRVKPTATAQNTAIQFENDPVTPASFNTISHYLGLTFKRPVLTNGTVTITTEPAGAPTITNCPSAPVNAAQNQLVQFSISATDPNGDNLSLQASNLPSGATFTPSNPATGNTTVTGTFQWIPTTLQSGAFNVSFRATDIPDGNQSPFCNVTINVSTGPIGNAPDVICQVSSITVDQGQNVQLNVSASDADGDSITLTALNLPTGATFSPATTIFGPTPVQGSLSWTPSFAQSGAFTLTFQATDSDGLTDVCNTTVFVEEIDIDQLFTTSAVGQVPQGGVAGTPDVVIPVNFLNVQNSYGVQFDFVYDPTIFTPTQVQTTDRLAGFQVYEDLGDNPGRLRVLAFSLSGDPIAAGTTSLLFNIVGNVVAPNAPGLYPITFENAWESISPDPEAPSVQLATSDGVIAIDNLGDANLDTRIDIGDVVAVVGYILSNYQFNLRQFVAGDVTVDALLDVFDLVGIINLIYGLPIGPSPDQPEINNPPAYVKFEYDVNDGPYGSYRLSTETEVDIAGAQVAVAYDPRVGAIGAPQLEDDASGLSLQYRDDGSGHLTALLLYNPNEAGSVIRTGQSKVLRIPLTGSPASVAPVTLRSIKLAATDASEIEVESASAVPRSFTLMQNYPNPFNPSTRIAFTISGAQSAATVSRVRLDIFNVLGQRVTTLVDSHLEPGQYEFEWDGRDRSGNTMASGLYFYRLQADGRAETKKMVLLK